MFAFTQEEKTICFLERMVESMLTAKDIRNKHFEKAAFGYKQEEIDEFLQELESDLRAMEHDREDANSKIQLLADKVREYRQDEEALKDALLGAQKEGRRVVAEAQEKADQILQEAQEKAQAMIDEAGRDHEAKMEQNRAEIAKEQEALHLVQNQVVDFKKQLIEMYRSHLSLISQIPEDFSDSSDTAESVSEEPEDLEETELLTPVSKEEDAVSEQEDDFLSESSQDPFATSQFSAKTVRGEFESRYSDLKFGKKKKN